MKAKHGTKQVKPRLRVTTEKVQTLTKTELAEAAGGGLPRFTPQCGKL